MKILRILALFIALMAISAFAQNNDALLKVKDPARFIAENDYNSRVAIFQK